MHFVFLEIYPFTEPPNLAESDWLLYAIGILFFMCKRWWKPQHTYGLPKLFIARQTGKK